MADRDKSPKVYLAGPTVFLPNALPAGRYLVEVCSKLGLNGCYPIDPPAPNTVSAREIFKHNVGLLRRCDLMVADLSPFRGPHADDGTSFEVGMAYALGLPIFAYTTDVRPLSERIPASRDELGTMRDACGLEVESFGNFQNLMLSESIVSVHDRPEDAILAAARHFRLA
ncbi:Nucleoside 2-deoxyribosyltransferase [Bradyrhizobium shewense]|uniref:Nucleoside 2-deoxyribosyltransferase n=1 Tax=Bradyrhizobium shewense TaxID=1761772 RepID=A0A1C3XI74_9BRAD|nr:nucleoside 2-deoxyribosyltransferase [Bradyrhizobium shewense]SCB51776.1 Nucleoside 2-deoxyribosyltransferase [Bradyrhizobium shewense]